MLSGCFLDKCGHEPLVKNEKNAARCPLLSQFCDPHLMSLFSYHLKNSTSHNKTKQEKICFCSPTSAMLFTFYLAFSHAFKFGWLKFVFAVFIHRWQKMLCLFLFYVRWRRLQLKFWRECANPQTQQQTKNLQISLHVQEYTQYLMPNLTPTCNFFKHQIETLTGGHVQFFALW